MLWLHLPLNALYVHLLTFPRVNYDKIGLGYNCNVFTICFSSQIKESVSGYIFLKSTDLHYAFFYTMLCCSNNKTKALV